MSQSTRIAELEAEVADLKGQLAALFAYFEDISEHTALPAPRWKPDPRQRHLSLA